MLLKTFCRKLARGLVGGVISPITTLISAYKMIKIIKDPDIPLCNCCMDDRHQHLLVLKYRIPFIYYTFQNIMWMVILIFLYVFLFNYVFMIFSGVFSVQIFCAGFYGIFNIVGGIACFINKDIFEASLDSIITPMKICFTCNRAGEKRLTHNLDNIMVQSALEIDTFAVITQINPKMDMHNQLLLERPTRLMYVLQVFEVLQELQVTNLPEALRQLILQYNSIWPSLLSGGGDGSLNRPILHRFSATRLQPFEGEELKIEARTSRIVTKLAS